jgi:hypothetical protein
VLKKKSRNERRRRKKKELPSKLTDLFFLSVLLIIKRNMYIKKKENLVFQMIFAAYGFHIRLKRKE